MSQEIDTQWIFPSVDLRPMYSSELVKSPPSCFVLQMLWSSSQT